MLAALQRAHTLFPFPMLGLDTDNGPEFINEEVMAYCAQEQITFTRGRPSEKNDHCLIEQKNRVVVRQVVGYERLHQQLTELYGALRLYVSCFQPSMKLVAKHDEGRTVRREYDAARTPLQRLLLAGVLPASKQQELHAATQILDPIRLFRQVRRLQQAVFRCAASSSPLGHLPSTVPLLIFSLESCTARSFPAEEPLSQAKSHHAEPVRRDASTVSTSSSSQAGAHAPIHTSVRLTKHDLISEARADCAPVHTSSTVEEEQNQVPHTPTEAEHPVRLSVGDQGLTIGQAIQGYLQHHQRARRQPKTVAWHQTALGQFQQYLLVERHVLQVNRLSGTDIRSWLAFLQETPTASGNSRSAHTIVTYARSVRAFCDWLVRRGHLAHSPCEGVLCLRRVHPSHRCSARRTSSHCC
ncbi:MAG: hypothetical protein J2P36_11900 [Ktedonobacteraceae bacterium]|nr:hypothetical protein [Ktedonobacteraceae bacterium]